MRYTLAPKSVARPLALGGLLLCAANVVGQLSKYMLGRSHLYGFTPLFNLSRGANVPAWYGSSILLICSALLALTSRSARRLRSPFAIHWAVLSLTFLYLSVDKAAQVHATVGRSVRLPAAVARGGAPLYSVIAIGVATVAVWLAVTAARFLRHLPRATRRWLLGGLCLYGAGAVILAATGDYYQGLYGNQNLTYQLLATARALVEMAGSVTVIYAVMSYLTPQTGDVGIVIEVGLPIAEAPAEMKPAASR